jgi:hypothetical protein
MELSDFKSGDVVKLSKTGYDKLQTRHEMFVDRLMIVRGTDDMYVCVHFLSKRDDDRDLLWRYPCGGYNDTGVFLPDDLIKL